MHKLLAITLFFLAPSIIANDLLWKRLQQEPNMVVFMRNAESSGNKDGTNMLVWDATGNCNEESTLTDKGKQQAKKIGEAFTANSLNPIVISSPMCRCKQTADIAFGNAITAPELIQAASGNLEKQERFQAKAIELMEKHKGQRPIVFINHRPNIDSLTMEMLSLGELLVGSILEDGEIEVLGKIKITQ